MPYFIMLLGAGVIFIGFLFFKKQKDLQRICTLQTPGKVVRMERKEEIKTEQDSNGHETTVKSVNYYPVFSYTVNNEDIEIMSKMGTNRPRFTEGQAVSVMYDPANSKNYYILEDKGASRFGIYFMLFGVAVIIIGIIAIFVPGN